MDDWALWLGIGGLFVLVITAGAWWIEERPRRQARARNQAHPWR